MPKSIKLQSNSNNKETFLIFILLITHITAAFWMGIQASKFSPWNNIEEKSMILFAGVPITAFFGIIQTIRNKIKNGKLNLADKILLFISLVIIFFFTITGMIIFLPMAFQFQILFS